VVNPTAKAVAQGTRGMYFPPSQEKAASEMLGAACHEEAARALCVHFREQMFAI
ncbi:MAG: DUF6473 family protein, partial [Pseudomonadota bacterium]